MDQVITDLIITGQGYQRREREELSSVSRFAVSPSAAQGARPSHAHERCGNERERQPPMIDARARIGVRFHTGENQSDLLPHL